MDHPELLRRVAFLRGLSEADRASLGKRLVERRFAAGERIFDKGDKGNWMFLVASGGVRIFLPPGNPQGQRLVLRELVPGEHFGELALFDEQPRSASAEASAPTLLLELAREDFVSDLLHSREAVLAVLADVAKRMRETTELLGTRVAKDAVKEIEENLTWSERLADRIAELNGSWTFILVLLGLSGGWAALNAALAQPPDAYPYQFFNLLLALIVALQGPLIMMSQNRQSQSERAQAASDFKVNLKNEVGIETLRREVAALRRDVQLRLDVEQPKEGR